VVELNLKCDPEPFDALVSGIKTFGFGWEKDEV
jgi:hypothetical protein